MDSSTDKREHRALLLEDLRSNENRTLEEVTRGALEDPETDVDAILPPNVNKTLLEVACCDGREDLVETLLKRGANPNRMNEFYNRSALHFTVEAGNSRILEMLLGDPRTNADLRVGDQTALHIAARRGDEECVRILLTKGRADPNLLNSKGVTAIHVAATSGQREIVRAILESSKVPVDLDSFRDFRKMSTRDVLTKKMPDLVLPVRDDRINDHEVTPRIEDPETRFIEELKALKDVRIEESMKEAAKKNFPRATAYLMQQAVQIGTPEVGSTAAKIAVELGHVDVLREILNAHSELGKDLLLPACQELGVPAVLGRRSGNDVRAECFKLIMEQPSVDVHCEDEKGNSPLHYAARAESLDSVKTLLRSGSYIGHKNVFGVPPLAHLSPGVISDYFDECLRSENDRTDEFEIEFDYRCLIPHKVKLGRDETASYENSANSEMGTLAFIARNRALKSLLKHPLLSSFLYLKWHRIRHVLYANFIFYVLFYFVINAYVISRNCCGNEGGNVTTNSTTFSSNVSQSRGLEALALILLALLAIRESLQFVSSPRHYLSSFENILELALILLTGWLVASPSPQLGAVVILLSAWELVILIGQHPRMSTSIEMFKTVSLNFARFLFLYAFLILAFALAFFTLFKDSKDDTNFPDPGHSLFKTIIMLTGEFDANDIPFVTNPVLSHFIFILFVFSIAIVLFNLLNGLAVCDTAQILERSELVALISRTKLVSYAESVGSGLARLARFCPGSHPLVSFAGRILLFPRYLPQAKISVRPYKSNEIRIQGRPERTRDCSRWSMDPWIVSCARQVLSKRGQLSEIQKTMLEFHSINHKLEKLETVVEQIKIALANKNVNRE